MKLKEIHESADIQIVGFSLEDAATPGSRRLDTVYAELSSLIELFGEPLSTEADRYTWNINIDYRDVGENYGENNEDYDTASTSLYDYRDNEWTIGGKEWVDGYVLKTLLAEKGVIK